MAQETVIKSGKDGNTAIVDVNNRLKTASLIEDGLSHGTYCGEVFDVTSSQLTITSANCNSIMYIKNNEDLDIQVAVIFVNAGLAASGTGRGTLTYVYDPTAGTLISAGTTVVPVNRRVGDNQTLCATITRSACTGACPQTLTGGTEVVFPYGAAAGFETSIPSSIVIPKGRAFGIKYTPPASNSSQKLQVGFLVLRNGDFI